MSLKTLDDIDVSSKTVLLRVDINQPVDKTTGEIKDTTRIKAATKTIKELSYKGAKVVILAHQGSDIEYGNFYTTKPHAKILSDFLGKNVKFIPDVCGPFAKEKIKAMQDGDIILLDNVRFESEEQTLFELNLKLSHEEQAKTRVVSNLAPLADIFVNDAFAAAHRDQPSLCGFPYVIPAYMGRLFHEEYSVIKNLMENKDSVYILGGAKIADAFMMLETVLKNKSAELILTGGLVGNIILLAKGVDIGEKSRSFIEYKGFLPFVDTAKEVLKNYPGKVLAPIDMAYVENGIRYENDLDNLDLTQSFLDIGQKTTKIYNEHILNAKTVFVNGPLGVFEEELTEFGTKSIWETLGKTNAYTVVGGGDSITACNKYGTYNEMDYICTGGGALIRMLTGEELPAIKALTKN